jgi:hypothetical protein
MIAHTKELPFEPSRHTPRMTVIFGAAPSTLPMFHSAAPITSPIASKLYQTVVHSTLARSLIAELAQRYVRQLPSAEAFFCLFLNRCYF